MNLPAWLLVLALSIVGSAIGMSTKQPITEVEKIRTLSREEAARALPVRLTGAVTYCGWENFVLHDGQSSVFVDFRFSKSQGHWSGPIPDLSLLEPGAGVEIEGVTDPGGFSPMVLAVKFRRIGLQPIPPPIRPTAEKLLSGALDTQWVEVEGVVRKFDDYSGGPDCLTLLVGGHPCPVLLRNRLGLPREQVVDAKVRVRGVVLNLANLRSQMAGMKLHSNGVKDIDILVAPPTDPFLSPRVALNRLIPFHPDADLSHRRVSSGVVTFAVPGRFFYLLDRGTSVRVDSAEARVVPGDLIEVSGFIDTTQILASFSGALVRTIGKGSVPEPELADVSGILNPRTRSWEEMVTEPGYSDSHGRLIRLSGVLRRVLPTDKDGNALLVIESGKHLVEAFLPVTAAPMREWIEGSEVELTGVCELEMERLDMLPWFSITGFHLWLSSPEGVRVLAEPPWWTPRRLGILLGAVLLVLGLALVWGYTMRCQVAVRSTELAGEISARESARLEFDTILRERRRLANDLHDTLEQALTGLALQLEITDRSKASNPELSSRHLHLAQHFLDRSRREVHRTVWDLRAHGLDGRDVIDVLHERATAMVDGSPVAITVARDGSAAPLPDLLAGNLLLLAQEAVTNALKHGAPSHIELRLHTRDDEIELEVRDDGRGFDPAAALGQLDGHFGLQGMHERAKRIGGTLDVTSTPGCGTSITIRLPLSTRS
jgi:signal transduction histidine kinase